MQVIKTLDASFHILGVCANSSYKVVDRKLSSIVKDGDIIVVFDVKGVKIVLLPDNRIIPLSDIYSYVTVSYYGKVDRIVVEVS